MTGDSSVSVVTPTFRDHNLLDRAEISLRRQTHDEIEWVIVDSSGENHVKERADIYVYQQPKGVSAARNRGIKEASGDYIVFLDADDWFAPQMIEKCVKTNQDFVFTDVVDVVGQNKSYREAFTFSHDNPPHVEFFRFDGIRGNIATSSIVVRQDFLGDRRFNTGLAGGEDYHLWVHLLRDTTPAHIPEPLTFARQHDQSLSSDPDMMYENRLRAIELLCNQLPELRQYRRERIVQEKYDYARHLLFNGRTRKARRIFWRLLVNEDYYRSLVMIAVSSLPSGHKRVIERLDSLYKWVS